MTCVRQPRKLKAQVSEDAEQYGLKHASLVNVTAPGCGDIPNRRPLPFCFCAGHNNTCPHGEWQVSPVMSHGDITMQAITKVTTIGSIGSGNCSLKKTVAAWEVGA